MFGAPCQTVHGVERGETDLGPALRVLQEQRLYRSIRKADGPPHIYGVADAAYHAMLHQRSELSSVYVGGGGDAFYLSTLFRDVTTAISVFYLIVAGSDCLPFSYNFRKKIRPRSRSTTKPCLRHLTLVIQTLS